MDLNAILYVREVAFADHADTLGDSRRAATWRRRAQERAATMHELMWDDAVFADFFRHLSTASTDP